MGEFVPPPRKKKKKVAQSTPYVSVEDNTPQPKALSPYQREIVAWPWYDGDKAITCTLEKARRIGGSEAASIRALCWLLGRRVVQGVEGYPDGAVFEETPMSGIVISKDWAGSKDVILKIAENVREMAMAGDPDCIAALPHIHFTKIEFPTKGTKVEAVPGSHGGTRGKTGFVILDEFAFVRDQEGLWAAAKPVANPQLGTMRGFPMLAITTPWEAGSWAHQVFTDVQFGFKRFKVDIWQAAAQGFPIDPVQAFRELGIPELIDTEYLCKWSRGGESFFNMEKLRMCIVDDEGKRVDDGDEAFILSSGLPRDHQKAPVRIGIDCGGGEGRDFTAAVMCKYIEGQWWMVGIVASNQTHTIEMADRVSDWILDRDIIDPTAQVDVRCDRGVMGADFIRQLHKRLHDRKRTSVTGVGMTNEEQEFYAVGARKMLERGQIAIYVGRDALPKSMRDDVMMNDNGAHNLMLELSRIKAKRGQGHLTFTTPRDTLRGHCDRAWAFLMGLEGAEGADIRQLTQGQLVKLYGSENDSRWGSMAEGRGFG